MELEVPGPLLFKTSGNSEMVCNNPITSKYFVVDTISQVIREILYKSSEVFKVTATQLHFYPCHP